MTSYNDFDAACDPFLCPEWRFKAIERLAENRFDRRQRKYLRIDPILINYADELRAYDAFVSPDVNAANKIFKADAEHRAEIEARVLADQEPAAIADCVQVPENVIRHYEYLFFDVRARFKAKYWLARRTYRFPNPKVRLVDNVRAFWSYYALAGGPVVLDELISVFKESRCESDPFSLAVFLKEERTVPLRIQTAAARWVIPVCQDTFMFYVRTHAELMLIDRMQFPISKSEAMRHLMLDIVEMGRKFAGGEPIPKARRRRSRSKKASSVVPERSELLWF